MQLTISHGMQSATVTRPDGTTIGALLADSNIRAMLGVAENVTPVVGGSVVDNTYVLEDGDEVTFQGRASTKA